MKRKMRIVITAGPTKEFIDPVRFLSNPSTGTFGYEIAKEASRRGHRVTLISGPTLLAKPEGVKRLEVESAQEMYGAFTKEFKGADCAVMTAAVADFTPIARAKSKIKKDAHKATIKIEFKRTKDILAWAGKNKKRQVLVGFALESENLLQNAKKKLLQKNADIIVANKITKKQIPFGTQKSSLLILEKGKSQEPVTATKKSRAAEILLDKIEALWYNCATSGCAKKA